MVATILRMRGSFPGWAGALASTGASLGCGIIWWSWPGSNRRPRECHSRALPTALQPHRQKKTLTACHGRVNRRDDAPRPDLDGGDRDLEGARRGRDVGFALADHRQRAAGRAQEAHVQAVRRAGPAVADAGRTGQEEDRHDPRAVASVVDVRGDAVREGAVARARRGRPVPPPWGVAAWVCRATPASPGPRPGRRSRRGRAGGGGRSSAGDRRRPPRPRRRAARGPRGRRRRARPRRAPGRAGSLRAWPGRRLAGDDVDAHSLHGGAREGAFCHTGWPRHCPCRSARFVLKRAGS